jgi:hypothetical protein
MVFSAEEIEKKDLLRKKIDYRLVNNVLRKEKYKSIGWLNNALAQEKKTGPSDYEMALKIAKEEFEKQMDGIKNRLTELEKIIK